MSEEMLIRYCSPTLAGIKTGSMFTTEYDSEEELRSSIRKINNSLCPKGIRTLLLRLTENRALIYIYRPSRLKDDLRHPTALRLLAECGYNCGNYNHCIVHLVKRIRETGDFPHEIGFFLGYPPEDVCGFIENKAEGCKCVGCWKVYGDAEEAQKIFAQYKKCTREYLKHWHLGKSVERLTVSV